MKTLLIIPFLLFSFYSKAQSFSFRHNGILRDYILYVPSVYNANNSVALVFNLHGYTSNASQQQAYTMFNQVADTANFILCYPNGIQNSWNAGNIFASNEDDIGFISALIDTISRSYNINLQKVYSTGMSNGGFMSYHLACHLGNRIAAIASVTGSMTPKHSLDCLNALETPIMQIHGTADPTVPYNGDVWTLSMDSVLSYWKIHNNCIDTLKVRNLPNTNTLDGTTTTTYRYNNCNFNTEVILYKVINGTHTWPGAIINTGTTSYDFSASGEIWNFFNRHTLHPQASSINNNFINYLDLNIYPNPTSKILHIDTKEIIDEISIYNLFGQEVYYKKGNIKLINVAYLATGTYFVEIISNSSIVKKKFAKN